MLTIILALAAAAVLGYCGQVWFNTLWASVPMAVVGLAGVAVPLNLWLKKRLESIFYGVQDMLQSNQARLQRQIQQMQGRMMGSPKGLQKRIEKDQTVVIHQAIKDIDEVKHLQWWNLMVRKQANTLRAQLHYQVREFDQAEAFFKDCITIDPLTVAMRMALLYRKNDMDKLASMYKKYAKKFKGDQCVVIHALYTWALVKQNRIDEALAILADVTEKLDNQLLKTNWEHLANGRVKSFSNTGLGDVWYALHLEEPKAARVKQYGGKRR